VTGPQIDPDRLRALHEAKAAALVRDHFGLEPRATAAIAGGAALHEDTTLWVYVAGEPDRCLGRSLVLADRLGAGTLHLMVDADASVLARRSAELHPSPQVWQVVGRTLVPAVAAPLREPAGPPPGIDDFVSLLREADLEVVCEHGVVTGEVRGLEVARIAPADDGALALQVGVGRFDQEASAIMQGHLPTAESVLRAADLVREYRRPDAAPHPINRLGRERWLRAQLLDAPASLGLYDLQAVAPPVPRKNLRDATPAAATGLDAEGARVLVVCSVGIVLELVPSTADLVARERPDRVVLVMPARDVAAVQQRLATRLGLPTELVAVEGDWPA